jgi:2-succinyl-5-enolpyruvyl-6-hydroxy-3-cyclohexene-1-carboxylate synthase
MYGLNYAVATDEISLVKGLDSLCAQNGKPSILEVFKLTLDNNSILLLYFKELI